MKLLSAISMLFTLLLVTGCGSLPWNPQGNAGITHVELSGCEADEGASGQLFCDIDIIDGKEKTNVDVKVVRDLDKNTVTATYTARNVAAFEGQAIRGEVEQAITESIRQVLPAMTGEIINGIKGTP